MFITSVAEKFRDLEATIPSDYKIDQASERPQIEIFAEVVGKTATLRMQSTKEAEPEFEGGINTTVMTMAKGQNGTLAEIERQFHGHVAEIPTPDIKKRYGAGTKKDLQFSPFWLTGHANIPILRKLDILNRLVCWHFDQMDADRRAKTAKIKEEMGISATAKLKELKQLDNYQEYTDRVDYEIGTLNGDDKNQFLNPEPYQDTLLPNSWVMCILNYCNVRRYMTQFYTFCELSGKKEERIEPPKFEFVYDRWNPKE